MKTESPKKIEKLLVMKEHLLFIYKRYELVEEVVPIGNNLLLLYKHDHLSDETAPKKNQNVRLFNNEGHILWTVQNPSSIIFLGIRYKDGQVQLIASDGNLYGIDLETGDIGLGSTSPAQSYPDTSCQWYNTPHIKGVEVSINHPPEKIEPIDNYHYCEFYRRDDLVEKIIDFEIHVDKKDIFSYVRYRLAIYKYGKLCMKDEPEESQYIHIYNHLNKLVSTIKNPSDDVLIGAKYKKNGCVRLVASNGNSYDLNVRIADKKFPDSTTSMTIVRASGIGPKIFKTYKKMLKW